MNRDTGRSVIQAVGKGAFSKVTKIEQHFGKQLNV